MESCRQRMKKRSSNKQRDATSVICKKHPKHRQSPGVCSLCLRERLSKLSCSSRRVAAAPSSCGSSPCSSSPSSLSSLDSSGSSSPMRLMTKSRSVAFFAADDGKRRGGFWSKLLPLRSRTMTQNASACP